MRNNGRCGAYKDGLKLCAPALGHVGSLEANVCFPASGGIYHQIVNLWWP